MNMKISLQSSVVNLFRVWDPPCPHSAVEACISPLLLAYTTASWWQSEASSFSAESDILQIHHILSCTVSLCECHQFHVHILFILFQKHGTEMIVIQWSKPMPKLFCMSEKSPCRLLVLDDLSLISLLQLEEDGKKCEDRDPNYALITACTMPQMSFEAR